jgi:hypothetical protein
MLKELAWYMDDNRFTNIATELQESIDKYAGAKEAGAGETVLSPLRESARFLFEEHCVRSGLRNKEAPYINIDAEFFEGNKPDQKSLDIFINNILKNHGYQRVLWMFMGTTGSFTQISKNEMSRQGLQYEDYLPIEYKATHPPKKPLEDRLGENEVPIYLYSDGTVSMEYSPPKARFRLDALADRSGIDWKEGYNPNGAVLKEGWHGEFNGEGAWVRVDETFEDASSPVLWNGKSKSIEIIKYGNTAILYDPEMTLLTADMILYLTEGGETYGNLTVDNEETVKEIKKSLEEIGVDNITAIAGVKGETAALTKAYGEVLKELAAADLRVIDYKTLESIRERERKESEAVYVEKKGVALERTIQTAVKSGGSPSMVMNAVTGGMMAVPLNPREKTDGKILGLSEEEISAIAAIEIRPEDEKKFETVLSNLYAAWPEYEAGGTSKAETAKLVSEYITGNQDKKIVLNGKTTLERIIRGPKIDSHEGVNLYASGIPGTFREPDPVDFYNESAKISYIRNLEKKRILPKGGGTAALKALGSLPEGGNEKKLQINRSITRTLGEYRAISMSTGLPVAELIEAVISNIEGKGHPALNKAVYYELSMTSILAAASKENRQSRESTVKFEDGNTVKPEIVIGGSRGAALDETFLTREKLEKVYGYSAGELDKASPFLHSIRIETDPALYEALIFSVLEQNEEKTAAGLKRELLSALDSLETTGYNLYSTEGLAAYKTSGRFKTSKLSQNQLNETIEDSKPVSKNAGVPNKIIAARYKSIGSTTPLKRINPPGQPEKLWIVQRQSVSILDDESVQASALLIGQGAESGIPGTTVEMLSGINETRLEKEYGYSENEAKQTAELFRQMKVPKGREKYYEQVLSPLVLDSIMNNREAEGFKYSFANSLRGRKDTVYDLASPTGRFAYSINNNPEIRNTGYSGSGESGPVFARPVFYAMPVSGDISLLHGTAGGMNVPNTVNFMSPAALKGENIIGNTGTSPNDAGIKPTAQGINPTTTVRGGAGSTPAFRQNTGNKNMPDLLPGMATHKPARGAEIERLGKIEASYAYDNNAGTADTKNPAPGRSGGYTAKFISPTIPKGENNIGNSGIPASRTGIMPITPDTIPLAAVKSGGTGENTPAFEQNIGDRKLNIAPSDPLPGMATHKPDKDAEIERLRQIEANYEHDKARMTKEKTPVLARSDSHDVGHAEGSGGDFDLKKIAQKQRINILQELKSRKGV